MTLASIHLWGTRIGVVQWHPESRTGAFEYDPHFLSSGIELSPLQMPLDRRVYRFPALARTSFAGLPGMLADALPDRFGRALIDAWLVSQGRRPQDFNPVERLCYLGKRAMGALEFEPSMGPQPAESAPLQVEALRRLAETALQDRQAFVTSLTSQNASQGALDILRVGTSAGGARAKAVIAWNRRTGEVRSGQVPAGEGFTDWILKFDGVAGNRDRELTDPEGYGQIEFAYSRMAGAAGIRMQECRLLEESGRRHFMTRRFDRDEHGRKIHMQSLAALAHLDFDLAGAHSYEQALDVMRRLDLPLEDFEEQVRRTAFNVMARNQDDHVKNIAYLMDREGRWSLSPAFDVTYAYNPEGAWTDQHQMSLAGKRDHFERADLERLAEHAPLPKGRLLEILAQVEHAIQRWPEFAEEAQIPVEEAERIARTHRKLLSSPSG